MSVITHPIVRQTMATTNTADVDATIEQVMRCADEGFDLVRVTVQGKREANACMKIREGLFKKGYDIPLCADMHFQPLVAQQVAEAVEKIRINPGNFADGRKDFEEKVYESEEDYFAERGYLLEAMQPLVEKCWVRCYFSIWTASRPSTTPWVITWVTGPSCASPTSSGRPSVAPTSSVVSAETNSPSWPRSRQEIRRSCSSTV